MPTVKGEKFPYTKTGVAAAKKAAGGAMPMMGKASNKMMAGPMPPTKMPMANPAPAKTNPALAKLPTQAKAYGVRGTKPPTKRGK